MKGKETTNITDALQDLYTPSVWLFKMPCHICYMCTVKLDQDRHLWDQPKVSVLDRCPPWKMWLIFSPCPFILSHVVAESRLAGRVTDPFSPFLLGGGCTVNSGGRGEGGDALMISALPLKQHTLGVFLLPHACPRRKVTEANSRLLSYHC